MAKKAVKTAATKTATKVVKKNPSVKKAKAVLQDAPAGKEFFLLNGKKVKNYKELAKVMEDIEDHVFRHHVNAERNDFATWTKEVFNDIKLAKEIAGIDSKDKLELVLYRRIQRGK